MDPSVKKIINNGTLIRRLAPMLDGSAAGELANVAQLYADLLSDFGIKPQYKGFEGCDEAKLLVKWISGHDRGDEAQIRAWTAAIWRAIDDLVAGELPA